MTPFEKMAKAGYEAMFEDKWDDLHPNSVERHHWERIAEAMIRSFDFPQDFIRLYRDLFMNLNTVPRGRGRKKG